MASTLPVESTLKFDQTKTESNCSPSDLDPLEARGGAEWGRITGREGARESTTDGAGEWEAQQQLEAPQQSDTTAIT